MRILAVDRIRHDLLASAEKFEMFVELMSKLSEDGDLDSIRRISLAAQSEPAKFRKALADLWAAAGTKLEDENQK